MKSKAKKKQKEPKPAGLVLFLVGILLSILATYFTFQHRSHRLQDEETQRLTHLIDAIDRFHADQNWGTLRRTLHASIANGQFSKLLVQSPTGQYLYDEGVESSARSKRDIHVTTGKGYLLTGTATYASIIPGWIPWAAGGLCFGISLLLLSFRGRTAQLAALGISQARQNEQIVLPKSTPRIILEELHNLQATLRMWQSECETQRTRGEEWKSKNEQLTIQLRDAQTGGVLSQQRTHRLQTIFEQSTEVMGFLSLDGVIMEMNDMALDLAGEPMSKLRGKRLADVATILNRHEIPAWIKTAKRNEIVRKQLEVQSSKEEPRVFDVSIKPLLNESGNIELFIFEAHDITDRIRAEQALHDTVTQFQQNQKMDAIGRLAGGIAHDFNNLLTSILGFSNMVVDQVKDQPEVAEDMNEVIQSATRAQNLTQKLLAMSRQDNPDTSVFDLNQLLREMDNLLRVTIHEDIDFVLSLTNDICTIEADTTSLEQVIVNLAVNARDAMPRSGRLYIETLRQDPPKALVSGHNAASGPYVKLVVRDTGAGMEPDVIEKIFEPFFTTKESGQGTGLGLSTVYAIVQQYKGIIDIQSEPGVGTEFNIYFPFAESIETAASGNMPPAENLTELPKGEGTILLVEDQDGVRKMAGKLISSLGYKLLEAADGEAGAKLAEHYDGTIDLIVTDVVMPNLSGPEMIDRLRVSVGYIPHLYVSGFTQDKLKQHGADGSEHLLIRKPYSRETLARRIHEELQRHQKNA